MHVIPVSNTALLAHVLHWNKKSERLSSFSVPSVPQMAPSFDFKELMRSIRVKPLYVAFQWDGMGREGGGGSGRETLYVLGSRRGRKHSPYNLPRGEHWQLNFAWRYTWLKQRTTDKEEHNKDERKTIIIIFTCFLNTYSCQRQWRMNLKTNISNSNLPAR